MRQRIDYPRQSMIPGGLTTIFIAQVVLNVSIALIGVKTDVQKVNAYTTSGMNA